MTGFNLYVLVLLMNVASALEGLSVPPEIVVWSSDTFDNNFENENDFTKYLKMSG